MGDIRPDEVDHFLEDASAGSCRFHIDGSDPIQVSPNIHGLTTMKDRFQSQTLSNNSGGTDKVRCFMSAVLIKLQGGILVSLILPL